MYPAGEPEKNGAGQMGHQAGHSGAPQNQNGRVSGSINGAANGASLARYENESDEANLNLNDPRTRLLMDQLVNVLIHENRRAPEEKVAARQFDWNTVLAMLRRRWPVMLGVFLLMTGVVAGKLRPGQTAYVATATVLLPQQDKTPKLDDLLQQRSSDMSSNVQTQTAIITSPPLVEKAWLLVPEKLRQKGWPLGHVPLQAVRAAAPVSPD